MLYRFQLRIRHAKKDNWGGWINSKDFCIKPQLLNSFTIDGFLKLSNKGEFNQKKHNTL